MYVHQRAMQGPLCAMSLVHTHWLRGQCLVSLIPSWKQLCLLVRLDSKALKNLEQDPYQLRWATLSHAHLKHKFYKCLEALAIGTMLYTQHWQPGGHLRPPYAPNQTRDLFLPTLPSKVTLPKASPVQFLASLPSQNFCGHGSGYCCAVQCHQPYVCIAHMRG